MGELRGRETASWYLCRLRAARSLASCFWAVWRARRVARSEEYEGGDFLVGGLRVGWCMAVLAGCDGVGVRRMGVEQKG